MKSAVRCAVVLTFVGASALSAGSAFVPEDHYLLRSASEVAISQDGGHVAYVERWVDRGRNRTRSRVVVCSLPDGEPRAVSDEEFDADRPRWSPDGTRLAFVQGGGATLGSREVDEPRQSNVVVVDVSDGSQAMVASVAPSNDPLAYQGVGNSLTWSPDGKRLAFLSSDPGPEPPPGDPMVITRYDYKSWAGMNDNRRWHVYLVSLEEKAVRRLTEGEYHDHSIAWSPSGEEIVFVSNRGADWHRVHNYDLFAVRVDDGTIRRLTHTEGVEYAPAWSVDGGTLAFRGGARSLSTRESSAEDWHLWAIPAAGGKAQALAPGLDRRVMRVAWAPDEPVVYFTAEDHGSTVLYRVDAESGAPEKITAGPGRVGDISIARSGVVAYTLETITGPAEVYLQRRGEGAQAVTSLNAGLLAERRVSIPEAFEFRSFDGTPVEGFLVPPLEREAGKRYPVILRIHGGPHGQQGPGFDHKSQVYAGSGYAVVMVNYRGSSGYGQEFSDGTVGDQNGDEFKDVMAGLDAILEQRVYLDPQRMGVEGGSYGGQLTNWAITQTRRFKAAIPSASISNLISLGYTIWAQDYIQVEFGGHPWQQDIARFMWERSPLAHVSNVRTPTMFIHGEEDQDVSVVEAEQMYMALKQVGVDAVFLEISTRGARPARARPRRGRPRAQPGLVRAIPERSGIVAVAVIRSEPAVNEGANLMLEFGASGKRGFALLSVLFASSALPRTSDAQIWQVDPEIKDELRFEKLDTILLQALKDQGIDLWLVFDRDADDERVNIVWEERRKTHLDPVSEHIGTAHIYQPAAFLFTPDGARVAIVSRTDQERIAPNVYTKIVTYEYTKRKGFEDIFPLLREEVERIAPATIGVNWSKYEPMADGLSLGMFRLLEEILSGLEVRFVSAEDVVVSLLGRNTPEEVAYLQESAEISHQLMAEAFRSVRVGTTTERDLFNFIRFRMDQLGVEPGWNEVRSPIVTFQGSRSSRIPGEERAEPGRLLKINGGVRVKGLSIDLNMNAYVLRPGETAPPPKLQHMWDTVVKATEEAVKAIKPGVRCQDVDALARRIVQEAGYEEWGYETAHSVGTWIHGIGPTLGPDWSHFSTKTAMSIQVNDAYAVEPAVEAHLPELDATLRVHVQEMVVVRADGAHYMVPPQTKLLLIPSSPRASSSTSRP